MKYQGKEYFIFGRRQNGYFDIRTLNGEKVNKGSLNCKKVKLLEKIILLKGEKLFIPPQK